MTVKPEERIDRGKLDAMKTILARRYGGPEVLELADRPEPAVGPNDVLIAVRAASLNPLDCKIRDGKVKLPAASSRSCTALIRSINFARHSPN